MKNKYIIFFFLISMILSQHTSKIQIIAQYEMNMSWISPNLIDSSFFTYDSFNFAGFSDIATDCYDSDFDVIEPPVEIQRWCRLTFPHYDTGAGDCWDNNFGATKFTQDIRYKDDNYLELNYQDWDIEFNAEIPGRVSFYLINDDIWADCNYLINHNNTDYNFTLEDTLSFWFTQFVNPPMEFKFSIGECISLKNTTNKFTKKMIEINNIYPNPFNPSLNINYFNPTSGNIIFRLINLKGQTLNEFKFNSKVGTQNIHIEIENLQSGKYFVQLITNNTYSNIMPIIYIK
jgi:hypothetical protein